ncbi:hypothetical protein BC830DRAFT_1164586 [Chytriomyces sp. MP71]|nr:hypothetical protein BC830DRAFT_1164586 [Chytriomyces sp. MP71]
MIHPLLGRSVPTKPSSCLRCRAAKRKCSAERPVCAYCRRANKECVYNEGAVVPSPVKSDRRGSSASVTSITSIGIGSRSPSVDAILVADEAPTIADFALLLAFFSDSDPKLTSDSPAHYLIDKDRFLASFFSSQPAPLRLVLCALAAYSSDMPSHVTLGYYNRAKRSMVAVRDTPAIKTVQTLFLLANFAFSMGQPYISKPLFSTALRMCLEMKLYLDPDEISPSLEEWEKEEHRRLFARVLYHVKYAQAVTDYLEGFQFSSVTVRQPAWYCGTSFDMRAHVSELWDLIAFCKRVHDQPPLTWLELLAPWRNADMNLRLMEAHAKIPPLAILMPKLESPPNYEVETFVSQIMMVSPGDTTGMILLSLNYHASICVLFRPIAYLTGFLDPSSPHLTLDHITILRAALHEAFHAALRIAALNQFLLDTQRHHRPHFLSRLFWMLQSVLAPALFESAVVLWFAACRVRSAWWMDPCAAPLFHARAHLGPLLESFRGMYMKFGSDAAAVDAATKKRPNVMLPLVDAVEAMLRDVQGDTRLEEIVQGMRVVALSEADGEVTEIVGEVVAPWIFLPLLGVPIAGGFRFLGGLNESLWREFWEAKVVK